MPASFKWSSLSMSIITHSRREGHVSGTHTHTHLKNTSSLWQERVGKCGVCLWVQKPQQDITHLTKFLRNRKTNWQSALNNCWQQGVRLMQTKMYTFCSKNNYSVLWSCRWITAKIWQWALYVDHILFTNRQDAFHTNYRHKTEEQWTEICKK